MAALHTYSRQQDRGYQRAKQPRFYITKWDYLANSEARLLLNYEDNLFKEWFIKFLDLHGEWINSNESMEGTVGDSGKTVLELWTAFPGDDQHPFDINNFVEPSNGYQTFNQFFLRWIKPGLRLLEGKHNESVIVSASDGGIFKLTSSHSTVEQYELPEKSKDRFNVEEAFPGYGACFVGGPLLDTLLWFTDFHHFFAPVSGKVLHVGEYEGSYN